MSLRAWCPGHSQTIWQKNILSRISWLTSICSIERHSCLAGEGPGYLRTACSFWRKMERLWPCPTARLAFFYREQGSQSIAWCPAVPVFLLCLPSRNNRSGTQGQTCGLCREFQLLHSDVDFNEGNKKEPGNKWTDYKSLSFFLIPIFFRKAFLQIDVWWPGTHFIYHTSLELPPIFVPLCSKCWEYGCMTSYQDGKLNGFICFNNSITGLDLITLFPEGLESPPWNLENFFIN